MKYLDRVKVINNKEKYNEHNIFKNSEGTIISAEIRNNCFDVIFSKENGEDFANIPVLISDLELVKDNFLTDNEILETLPQNNPNWWCKIENGFIINLKGEKKNKIPFDYNS